MGELIALKPPPPRPVVLTHTASGLIANQILPKRGDFVFLVEFADDTDGGVVVTVPGSGRVRAVTHTPRSVTLTFDFGLTITITGRTRIKWHPDPAGPHT
jgi:hypothetical protein